MGPEVVEVALYLESPALLGEVLRFLEAEPGLSFLGASTLLPSLEDLPSRGALLLSPLHASALPPSVLARSLVLVGPEAGDGTPEESSGGKHGWQAAAAALLRWPEEKERILPILRALGGSGPFRRGAALTLWGVKGGAGTTTISAHLALALSGRLQRICLLELGPFSPHGLLSGLGGGGLGQLLELGREADAAALSAAARPGPYGHLLLFTPGEWVPEDGLDAISSLLRSSFDLVILDAPGSSGVHALWADLLLLVTTPDLLGLRAAASALRLLVGKGYPLERVGLLLSRGRAASLGPEDFSRSLDLPVVAVLPEEASAGQDLEEGRWWTRRRTRLARALEDLVVTVEATLARSRGEGGRSEPLGGAWAF